MLQMEKNSRTRLEVMKEHKKQRMEELRGLVAKDRELCGIMCTSPFGIDQDAVPSLQQLKTYHTYLDNLTKEKALRFHSFIYFYPISVKFLIVVYCLFYLFQERRHDEFVSIKKEIVVCMEDLEQQPETSFEMDVMCEDEEAFCLSDGNISALKLLLGQVTGDIYK